jgi:hypothetical protein
MAFSLGVHVLVPEYPGIEVEKDLYFSQDFVGLRWCFKFFGLMRSVQVMESPSEQRTKEESTTTLLLYVHIGH